MSSQRKHDLPMAKVEREEAEKQEQAALLSETTKMPCEKRSSEYKWSRWHFKN